MFEVFYIRKEEIKTCYLWDSFLHEFLALAVFITLIIFFGEVGRCSKNDAG